MVRLATLWGEAAEVPKHVVADWAQHLPAITEGYQLADIYNADETGLYFRALPNRSMVVRDDPRKGIKTSKERKRNRYGPSNWHTKPENGPKS